MTELAESAVHEPEADVLAADDLDALRNRLVSLGRPPTPVDVAVAMRAGGRLVTDGALVQTLEALRRGSVGAGPLDPLLKEPGVTDVLVNGAEQVFVDRGQGLELSGIRFASDDE